ncbi:MAG: tetratricopeptide repeat protein [Rhodospirillaceae bacterium]|nr:tetratricopeptide repeat protein [Rhodospirillaceae bacterium]
MTSIDATLEAALTAHGEDRADVAFELYESVLGERPDYLHPSNRPGDASFDRPRKLASKDILAAVIDRLRFSDERAAESWELLGGFLQLAGDPSAAVDACKSALKMATATPEAALSLGLAHLDMHEFDQAVSVLSDAAARYPKNVRLLNHLGGAQWVASKFGDAIESFQKAGGPAFPVALANLGALLREARRFEDAIGVFQRLLEQDPAFPKAACNLCMTYMAIGKDDDAVAAGRRAVEDVAGPDFDDYNCFGGALLANDEHAAALDAFETSLSLNPRGVTALAMINGALAGVGQNDEVRRLLDFGRFMMPLTVRTPADYSDLAAFNNAIYDHAVNFPDQPGNERQTVNLVDDAQGPMIELERIINEAVARYIAQLPDDSNHPYTAYKPERWDLFVWATRAKTFEYQFPHIHPHGWVSGIYYPRVPAFTAPLDEAGQAVEFPGHVEFYRFLQFSQRPVVSESVRIPAEEGLMVLFPSYFHHGINPFESETNRMSIAFNAMPRD